MDDEDGVGLAPMTGVRCLVFDFDGVLVDSNRIKRDAYFEIFSHLPVAPAIVEEALQAHSADDRHVVIGAIVKRLASAGVIEAREDDHLTHQSVERYTTLCERAVSSARELPGTSSQLALLKTRFPLYLNSATPRSTLSRIVETRGWSHFFKDVLGRPQTKLVNLQTVLDREHISPAELLFIGDSPHDRLAATHCGCAFVAMRSDFHPMDYTGLDVVDDLAGLSDLLGLNGAVSAPRRQP
jgi:phosphoglycolate phosphatase-like HAD superfamily hydrolase